MHEPAGLTLSGHCTLSRKRQNVTISTSLLSLFLSFFFFTLSLFFNLTSRSRPVPAGAFTHLIKSNRIYRIVDSSIDNNACKVNTSFGSADQPAAMRYFTSFRRASANATYAINTLTNRSSYAIFFFFSNL